MPYTYEKSEFLLNTNNLSIFNEQDALNRLGNDKQLLAFIVQTYLNEMPAYLDELSLAVSSGEPLTISKAAHRLKGSSATIGLDCLTKMSLNLEMAGKNGEAIENLHLKYSELLDHVTEKAKPALLSWLADQKHSQ